MFKITHPDKSFEINNHKFKTQAEAESHMNLIRRYAKEFVQGGWPQEQADAYVNSFKIEEVK